MLKTKLLFMVVLMALFSGCAVVKQADTYEGKPYAIAPPDGKAMVVFYHRANYVIGSYGGQVILLVDGKKVSSIKVGEKSYAFVEPGKHKFIVYAVDSPSLVDLVVADGKLVAGGIYYLGVKYEQRGVFGAPGWDAIVALDTFQDKEKGDDLLAWLRADDLVIFNKEKAKKASLENADDIKEVLADAEKQWSETPKNKRLYLRESKRINEVDWRIDGKQVQPSLPYGNL